MYEIKGSTRTTIIKQGDIDLVPLPGDFAVDTERPTDGRAVLAHGEVTGHAHVIESPHVRITRDPDVVERARLQLVKMGILEPDARTVDAVIVVDDGAPSMLTHEEHEAHFVRPGIHALLRAREYVEPDVVRRVGD